MLITQICYDIGMTVFSKRRALVNTLGTFGYLSVLFQWAWSFLIACYPLISSGALLPKPMPAQPIPQSHDFGAFDPIISFVAIGITIFVLVVTAVFVAKLPASFGRQSARVTHKAAAKTTILLHPKDRPLPPKERQKLSYQLVLIIKLIAIALPLLVILFVPDPVLPPRIVWSVAGFCAVCSVIHFSLQQVLALLLKIKRDAIW